MEKVNNLSMLMKFDEKIAEQTQPAQLMLSIDPRFNDNHSHPQNAINVLLLEDNPSDVHLVEVMLAEASAPRNENLRTKMVQASYLADGLTHLSETAFDIILLDRSLPDCADSETLKRVRAHAPNVPVILLTGLDDETLSIVRHAGRGSRLSGKR